MVEMRKRSTNPKFDNYGAKVNSVIVREGNYLATGESGREAEIVAYR